MAAAQPYRATDVREGVALPRRGVNAWVGCCIIAALLPQVGLFVWLARHGLLSITSITSFVTVGLGTAWLVLVTRTAARFAIGRTQRPGLLILTALTPAFVAEVRAALDLLSDDLTRHYAKEDAAVAAMLLEPLAATRVALYATSAVAFAVIAVGAVGAVLSIDREHLNRSTSTTSQEEESRSRAGAGVFDRADIITAVLGSCAAIAFIVLRARGTHRDGLGGAIPIATVVLASMLAPVLATRLRVLRTWHADDEVRTASRAAVFAVIAVTLAGLTAERAALANDEHHAFIHLSGNSAFDMRLEHAHAYGSAWHAHSLAMVIVSLAALLPLITIARAAMYRQQRASWSKGAVKDGTVAAFVAIAAVLCVATFVDARSRVDKSPEPTSPENVVLPIAPGAAPARADGVRQIRLSANGALVDPYDQVSTNSKSFVFVVDRATPSFAVILARTQLEETRAGYLLVEGGPKEAITDLGAGAPLLGPRLSMLRLEIPAEAFPTVPTSPITNRTMMHGVLLILDDGDGIGRVVFRKNSDHGFSYGPPRGLTFRRDLESREKRHQLVGALTHLHRSSSRRIRAAMFKRSSMR